MANHPDLGDLASFYGVVQSHVVLPETKADFEQQVLNAVAEHDIELVVLARYMQILSPRLEALAGRAISIHHSFLPGSRARTCTAGARARVKLIGATATS